MKYQKHYHYRVREALAQHPFGMLMSERSYSSPAYRYGFNGKENDDEAYEGCIAFEARIFDSRISRFLSTDPSEREFAWQSTYSYFMNSPIKQLDFFGKGDGDKGKDNGDEKVKKFSKWKRFKNWLQHDAYENKANATAVKLGLNNKDVKTNSDGSVEFSTEKTYYTLGWLKDKNGNVIVDEDGNYQNQVTITTYYKYSGNKSDGAVSQFATAGSVMLAAPEPVLSKAEAIGIGIAIIAVWLRDQIGQEVKEAVITSGNIFVLTEGSRTAGDIIANERKGSINQEFPDEYRDKTLDEINKLAKAGTKAAKKAWKLLNDNRFKK